MFNLFEFPAAILEKGLYIKAKCLVGSISAALSVVSGVPSQRKQDQDLSKVTCWSVWFRCFVNVLPVRLHDLAQLKK